jgi:hypothetical protein
VTDESRAEEVNPLRPRFERRQADVRRHQSVALSDELKEFLLLGGIDRHLAVSLEKDGVDIAQARPSTCRRAVSFLGRLRDDVGIGADERIPQPSVIAELFEYRHDVSDRFMLRDTVAGIGPRKDTLSLDTATPTARAPLPSSGGVLVTGAPRWRPSGALPLPPSGGTLGRWRRRLLGERPDCARNDGYQDDSQANFAHVTSLLPLAVQTL